MVDGHRHTGVRSHGIPDGALAQAAHFAGKRGSRVGDHHHEGHLPVVRGQFLDGAHPHDVVSGGRIHDAAQGVDNAVGEVGHVQAVRVADFYGALPDCSVFDQASISPSSLSASP